VSVALLLSGLSEYTTPNTMGYIFVAGVIGSISMLLPGISGSFVLLLIGKYSYMINAVKVLDFTVLFVFGLGYFVGILSFAKLLNWILKRHFEISLLFLTGLRLGSFNKIWPWRVVENKSVVVGDDIYSRSVLPWQYKSFENSDPQIIICITIIISGFVLVMLMHWIMSKYSNDRL
jgi:putative membrane protein